MHIAATDPGATVLIMPADHAVRDVEAFHAALNLAACAAPEGRNVTFGIPPDRPETGLDYLELTANVTSGAAVPSERPREKSNRASAGAMLAEGRYLWNAGNVVARVDTLLAAFETHAPDLVAPVRAAVAGAVPDLGVLRLSAEPWAEAEDISIDYAMMERATGLSVVPVVPMERAQDLRLAVAVLKAEVAKQATEYPKDHFP
jgi:mannose-1-phosphate guanylyltransferase/mannose-6-phosphate isomerase